MSNYAKTTNFATKDALVSGDVNKIVKGTEIDLEFTNIQTAVATKADAASPSFTGTVTVAGALTVIDSNLSILGSVDATKILKVDVDANMTTGTTMTVTTGAFQILPPGIGPLPYSGATVPTGWLECDGSAISRTTYAALFAAISTIHGAGDGSTTFNLPDPRGRVIVGAGTGTTTESPTASSGNGFTVATNTTKWTTGNQVILSALTGFTTTATAGPTYFVVRISATNIRLATTLALAQGGSPDITLSGTGTATLTNTMSAHAQGERGGEESHAMSISELLSHTHTGTFGNGSTNPGNSATNGPNGQPQNGVVNIAANGGNAAMNNMQPFLAEKFIIST